VISASFKTF